jgi:uncharacterized protein YqgC (DUF456 family)
MAIKMIGVIEPLIGALVVLYAIYLAYQALFDSANVVVIFLGPLMRALTNMEDHVAKALL